MDVLGIDVGGSGIKAAPVDTTTGRLLAERHRLPTPKPATPATVGETIGELVEHFGWKGPIGCAFPAVVKNGVVHTAANIDKSWIGTSGEELLRRRTGCPVLMMNDADAAGVGEVVFGAGRSKSGVIIMVTLGTGIGTALVVDGQLLPNTELGHMEIRGKEAELRASEAVREREDLSWKEWAERVDEYLARMEALFWPDLIILGGGVSKKPERFMPYLTVRTPLLPAELKNEAGIIGAAYLAAQKLDLAPVSVGRRSRRPDSPLPE